MLKLATWNVNGIRARQAQVQEWIARERPDVVCLQEIKATSDQIPGRSARWRATGAIGTAARATRASPCRFAWTLAPERPTFAHPSFDYENRIVTVDRDGVRPLTVASVYVPNGGKDFRAKMQFLEAMDAYAAAYQPNAGALVLMGDMNVARTERDVHPKERKPRAIGQLPEERAIIERLLARGLVDVGRAVDPDNDGLFTWWAPWRSMRERNIGWRLDYVFASAALAARVAVVRCRKTSAPAITRR